MTSESSGISGGRRRLLAFTALVLGAAAMGISPIFVRVADVGPYASAFWRTFLALPFLWVWMRAESRKARLTPIVGDQSVLLAGLFFAGDLFFWHLAITHTTVANAAFLATTSPIWVALGAWLLASETVGWRMLLGLALCLLGGTALMGESYAFAPQRLWGDAFGAVTACFFGAYVLAVRAARDRHGAAAIMFAATAISSAILFAIAFVLEPHLLPRSLAGAAALLGLALISQVAGQGLLTVALGTLPATFSALVIFLEAIAAAGFGWLFLHEALDAVQGLGSVLIVAGIWIARPRG